ncbi:conserved hypothetical protein [Ricinus communis]|uniref:Uncharacterized protein n=1 Tax=Ricinus communis TaxID=3988 RepID=B9SDM3_RICCO|nr:conserved hypothetical protein [Ricinus communis]
MIEDNRRHCLTTWARNLSKYEWVPISNRSQVGVFLSNCWRGQTEQHDWPHVRPGQEWVPAPTTYHQPVLSCHNVRCRYSRTMMVEGIRAVGLRSQSFSKGYGSRV